MRALGFSQLRVRFHEDIARLELLPDELPRSLEEPTRTRIQSLGTELGFRFVAVDVRGFRSGSLNEGLVQIRSVRSGERS